VANALRLTLARHPDDTVVPVAHDSVNRALLLQLLDLPPSSYWSIAQSPWCINEIDVAEGTARILLLNETYPISRAGRRRFFGAYAGGCAPTAGFGGGERFHERGVDPIGARTIGSEPRRRSRRSKQPGEIYLPTQPGVPQTGRAIITIIGSDRVGIIAGIANVLAEANVNILDISQSVIREFFTMIMMVDLAGSTVSFHALSERLAHKGDELSVRVEIQREEIFKAMHRI
jgi:ACT domain-containing protein